MKKKSSCTLSAYIWSLQDTHRQCHIGFWYGRCARCCMTSENLKRSCNLRVFFDFRGICNVATAFTFYDGRLLCSLLVFFIYFINSIHSIMPFQSAFTFFIIGGCVMATGGLLGSLNWIYEGKRKRSIALDSFSHRLESRDRMIDQVWGKNKKWFIAIIITRRKIKTQKQIERRFMYMDDENICANQQRNEIEKNNNYWYRYQYDSTFFILRVPPSTNILVEFKKLNNANIAIYNETIIPL